MYHYIAILPQDVDAAIIYHPSPILLINDPESNNN